MKYQNMLGKKFPRSDVSVTVDAEIIWGKEHVGRENKNQPELTRNLKIISQKREFECFEFIN